MPGNHIWYKDKPYLILANKTLPWIEWDKNQNPKPTYNESNRTCFPQKADMPESYTFQNKSGTEIEFSQGFAGWSSENIKAWTWLKMTLY